ncbi:MAG: hypothetical protein AAFW46_08170 [Pseudomonadota bacterium]
MPLQNRVDPFGEISARPERGTLMGNRGGRLHDADKRLGRRRWVSKSWIACQLCFKGRAREVMGPSYTELFFLDEATALAAGHRPCFECRRADAIAFAEAWAASAGLEAPPRAAEMDRTLHEERLMRRFGRRSKSKRSFEARLSSLPSGAMVALWGASWLVADDYLLRWSHAGYVQAIRPLDGMARVLTPPSIVGALRAGYRPLIAEPLASVDPDMRPSARKGRTSGWRPRRGAA